MAGKSKETMFFSEEKNSESLIWATNSSKRFNCIRTDRANRVKRKRIMQGDVKMVIGVDADGVLTDMQKFNFIFGQRFFNKRIINPSGYTAREIFEVSKIKEILYGIKYFPQYCKNWPPRKDASVILNKLMAEGHDLHEITARKFVTSNSILGKYSRKWFLQWCENNEFSFSSVTFCSEKNGMIDKSEACLRLNIDIMIDDRPEIVLALAKKGIMVLMMDAPYNQYIRHEKAKRVFDWLDVYEKISEMSGVSGN